MAHAEDAARRRRPVHLEVERGDTPTHPSKKVKRKRRRKKQPDLPFWKLFLQVGATFLPIFIICVGTFRLLHPPVAPVESEEFNDDQSFENEEEPEEEVVVAVVPTRAPSPRTPPPLPEWKLSEQARFDAYGLVETYHTTPSGGFWELASNLRTEFSDRYGGENSARAILERGLRTFGSSVVIGGELPSDLQATACRLLHCNGDFKIAFGGYSVTAGRGNYFHQSFPFVMQQKLEPIFDALEIELEVRNAAVGGIPSLPYGWCLENFWGLDPDVVSWDYSMNEAGGVVQGLESYLRQSQSLLHKHPKLIVKDTHMAVDRQKLLQEYVKRNSSLVDPLVLNGEPAFEPFLAMEEQFRPVGFQEWRKFGAPPGAPGQAAHHPSKREHELYGWMLTMHFLAALEVMVLSKEGALELTCPTVEERRTMPPRPISTNDTTSILFGIDHKLQCRTSLQPIVNGKLEEIITSGVVDTSGVDELMPKGPMYYNKGWVLDLSEAERLAKRKLDRFGGLGFVDTKHAYYGIYSSGPISFHLPVDTTDATTDEGDSIPLATIVLCQVNERQRDQDACQPDKQMNFWIGGQNVTNATLMDAPGTLYLGHKLCMTLPIPKGAVVTTYQDQLGVNVTARVSSKHIYKKDLACSISHVVWEEK